MNGPKVNALTREQVRAAVAGIPPGGDYVWDGVDADDRPLSDAALQAGLAVALRKRGRPAGSDKTQIALRVDNETLAAFRATGAGWQSRMNAALGHWVKKHSAA
jgi:uncharacterized protein (DUF4415 family)